MRSKKIGKTVYAILVEMAGNAAFSKRQAESGIHRRFNNERYVVLRSAIEESLHMVLGWDRQEAEKYARELIAANEDFQKKYMDPITGDYSGVES